MTATPVSSIQPALQACNSINRMQFLALHLSQLISNFAPIALHCTVPLCLSAFAISSHACCQANCLTCALQFEGQALHPYKSGGINRCNFFAAKHLISAGAAPERDKPVHLPLKTTGCNSSGRVFQHKLNKPRD